MQGKMFHGGHTHCGEIDFRLEIPGNRREGKKFEIKATRVMRNAQ